MLSTTFITLSLAASGLCVMHTVKVGDGGLNFSPNSLTAAVGDQIMYEFVSDGHNVAQGAFANPCQPTSDTSFFSGDVAKGGAPFIVTVNSTDPIWYYCAQTGHCQNGMVGVINPPSGQTQSDFSSAAAKTDSSKEPAKVQGGVFGNSASGPSSMSSSMGMSSSSMMMSTSSMTGSATMTTGSAAAATTSGAAANYKPHVGLAVGALGVLAAL